MPPSRETFIRTQDIAPGQLIDTHPKPGERLRKLVDMRVLDTLFLDPISISAGWTSVRIDPFVLDETPATGPVDLGLLTDRKHKIFITGTDNGIADSFGKEVTGELVQTAPVYFQGLLTLGSNQSTTVGNPGDVQVGDTIRVQGQGLVSSFVSQIVNKTPSGPNYVLTFADAYTTGPSGSYTIERVARWTLNFVDSLGAPFPMPDESIEPGLIKRVYLADIKELYGASSLKYPELAPELGAGGAGIDTPARIAINHIIDLIGTAIGVPVGPCGYGYFSDHRVQIHTHVHEAFIILVDGVTALKLSGIHQRTVEITSIAVPPLGPSEIAEINVYRNGMLQLWNTGMHEYEWEYQTDVVYFDPPLMNGDLVVVKEVVKCPELLTSLPRQIPPHYAPSQRKENVSPLIPTALAQLDMFGVPIPPGGSAPMGRVQFQGTVFDPDGDAVKLQVEVKPFGVPFTNIPDYDTLWSNSGIVTTPVHIFAPGQYHWQARAKDANNHISAWISFGGMPSFIVT